MKVKLTSIVFFLEKKNIYIYHFITKCLKGKASEVYLALKPEQTSDYQTVIETILKAYELVPEAYRQKFRNFKRKLTRLMLNLRE